MAEYITTSDVNVALNNTIPFNRVYIPCNAGNVIPVAPGVLTLKGKTSNKFARYAVTVEGTVEISEGGAVTAIALAITLNGTVLPESIAIFTPQAVQEYGHISTHATITIPCGCCASLSACYVDGTEDDAAVTPTPSITVRRNASIAVTRVA